MESSHENHPSAQFKWLYEVVCCTEDDMEWVISGGQFLEAVAILIKIQDSIIPDSIFAGDKVSMLTHTCTHPHKPWGRLKWPYAITRLTAHFMCSLIWWFESLEKYGHIWHRMSLLKPGVIKQHKPNLTLKYVINSWKSHWSVSGGFAV